MMKICLVLTMPRGFSKSLGKRIAGNLQLCDLLVLIGGHCGKYRLGKCKRMFLIVGGGGNVYHWLVFVHRMQTGLVLITGAAARPMIGQLVVKYLQVLT